VRKREGGEKLSQKQLVIGIKLGSGTDAGPQAGTGEEGGWRAKERSVLELDPGRTLFAGERERDRGRREETERMQLQFMQIRRRKKEEGDGESLSLNKCGQAGWDCDGEQREWDEE